MRSLLFIMAIILGIQSEAWSQQLDYPELNVTPRASTRVNMEGKWEGENTLGNAWPLAVAGLGTLLATSSISDVIDDEKDPEGYSQTIGYTAGLLTLGASAYLALKFRPFDDMRNKLSKVGGKTTRGQLTRERIAEEELKRLSKLGYYSRITFSIMNLLANSAF